MNNPQWVETVMGEPLPKGDFGEILKDGVILCKLMNKIQPGSVKKFKEKVRMIAWLCGDLVYGVRTSVV